MNPSKRKPRRKSTPIPVKSSETLAGRISFIEVTPFNIGEVGVEGIKKLWFRGGFPSSLLAGTDEASILELPQLGY